MLKLRSWLAAASLAALAAGCAKPTVVAPVVTQSEWTDARRALAELRRHTPSKAFVEIVHVSLREPKTGHVLRARGAVAIDPHRAMRLVLLGPGGTTALDVWVTPDAWRFAVPELNVVRRSKAGDASADLAAGFPIEFFRWWFLEPLDGRLLFAKESSDPSQSVTYRSFVLANGETTVRLTAMYGLHESSGPLRRAFFASRRDLRVRGVDNLSWHAHDFLPGPGEDASYKQSATGFEVQIGVEEMSLDAPDPTAFFDPDQSNGASL